MIEKTKIALSAKELELVCDKEWILTKHIIIEKVYRLFGSLAAPMQDLVRQHRSALPEEAAGYNPKISRGENYGGLPYVMLDYPRYFTKANVLAIRTLFWWGNFFSINLHLSGSCKQNYLASLIRNFDSLQKNDYWLCIHDNPWEHHFEENNYVPLKNYTAVDFAARLSEEPFIKIAKRISLQEWDVAQEFLAHHFSEMITLLQISSQAGETGPSPGIPIAGFDL